MNIASSYCMFKENYSKQANNYKHMQVYGNNAFGYGRGMKNKLDENFFGIDLSLPIDTRKKLITTTWDSITQADRVLSIETIGNSLGINLTPDQYQKIQNTFRGIINKYCRLGETGTMVGAFLNKF